MKKSIITVVLLGFVLVSGLIVLTATLADDMVVNNKIEKIKEITVNTALAAAKHYIINEDIVDAEMVADGLLDQTKLGLEVKNSIVYTWDFVNEPNSVIVTVPTYSQGTFWYKFLGKDTFVLENIASKAEIISTDPIKDTSSTLAPLAINNCNRNDLVENAQINFTYTSAPYFNNADTDTFYAVDKDCSFPAGNSNFAHFKNLFGGGEVDYTTFDVADNESACLVQTSFQNPLSVDPMQLYNQLNKFTLPYQMDILMFDCGTTANDLLISNVLSIEFDALPPLVAGPKVNGKKTNILTISAKIVASSKEVILKY